MHEFITQPIPGGCLTPEAQVDEALSVIVTAAELLAFRGLTDLENALCETRETLLLLVSAGELAGISFSMQDPDGVCGVHVSIDPYGVADYEEVDLSTLRLLASPDASGQLDIVCFKGGFSEWLMAADWSHLSTDALSLSLRFGTNNDSIDDPEHSEEERDDDDNDVEDWRELTREIDDLYN
jgi:hypothetical protein